MAIISKKSQALTLMFVLSLCLFGVLITWYYLTNRVPLDHRNVSYSISPDGHAIAFSNAQGDLFTYSFADRTLVRLTNTPSIETDPAWSPDGTTIAFCRILADDGPSSIWSIEPRSGKTQRLTHADKAYDRMPSYSRDGSKLVFARATRKRAYSMGGSIWDRWTAVVMHRDGTSQEHVTTATYDGLRNPVFNRTNKEIVFSADREVGDHHYHTSHYSVDIDDPAKQVHLLSQTDGVGKTMEFDGVYSSNAKAFVFVADSAVPQHYEVYAAFPDGRSPVDLTRRSNGPRQFYKLKPQVIEDEGNIYFLAADTWTSQSRPLLGLWRIPMTGGMARQVLPHEFFSNPEVYCKKQGR